MGMGPKVTTMDDEHMLIHPEMVDEDNVKGFDGRFKANASIKEGCSGHKSIDTMYENTSCDYVENPREGSTPAPECLVPGLYNHRGL